jgi:hypothetical protein
VRAVKFRQQPRFRETLHRGGLWNKDVGFKTHTFYILALCAILLDSMRQLLLILIIVKCSSCIGQDASLDFPFQVLYSDGTKNKAGKEIKSLDMVSINEVLTIKQNGTLSLIHYNGLPIQIDNDTTINIKELQETIEIPQREKSKKGKKSSLDPTRPNIERLFISDSELAKKDKQSRTARTGMCFDCDNDLEVIYPPRLSNSLYFKGGLCLEWRTSGSKRYRIEIKNIFGEFIDSISVSTNKLFIADKEFKEIMKNEEIASITILDLENSRLRNGGVLKKYYYGKLEFPYSCQIDKATYAVMTGLYLEMLRWDYHSEAEKYYELATKLSDRTFYKIILEKFRQRRGG